MSSVPGRKLRKIHGKFVEVWLTMSWWNCPCRFTTVSETLKKSIASQVQANHLQNGDQSSIPLGGAKDATYPEKKRPHCIRVRFARTSNNGLAPSTFSLFGTRFRRKYGAIALMSLGTETASLALK